MRDSYLYPDSDVLKNLAGIQDSEELKNMEADYTLLRLSEIAEDESLTQFDFQTLCGLVVETIRKSGISDTEERIRQVILWNRKEKREHLPEEIRKMASVPEKNRK
ncbi:MAG: hypothetical protein U0N90_14025 [Blautia sp.]|jgi:hypothetical protein